MLKRIRRVMGLARAGGAEAAGGRPLRVLIAEDNAVNQKLLQQLLAKRGHIAVVARNGREALAALERAPFDLVLMDVQMPEIDGLQATAAIRQREKEGGGHIPILAVTAHADRERCLAAGMDDHVAKPVRATQLFDAIELLTNRGKTVRPAARGAGSARDVLNLREALSRMDGDRDLLAEVAAVYLEDCPRLLSAIRGAVAGGDAPALEVAAHALKGAVSNFGAGPARQAALRMETLGREGNLGGAGAALAVLENEIERLRGALISAGLVPGPSE